MLSRKPPVKDDYYGLFTPTWPRWSKLVYVSFLRLTIGQEFTDGGGVWPGFRDLFWQEKYRRHDDDPDGKTGNPPGKIDKTIKG